MKNKHKASRKHDKDRGGGGVNLSLIITPMLDMAFQLIAFFIMTYSPPAFEGRIDVELSLPAKIATKGPKSDPLDKSLSVDEEPKDSDWLQVTIKAVAKEEYGRVDGEPRALEIKQKEDKTPTLIAGDTTLGREAFIKDLEDELQRRLKALLKNPSNESMDIKLSADPNLRHRYLMKFYDDCKEAGCKKIRFVVEGSAK